MPKVNAKRARIKDPWRQVSLLRLAAHPRARPQQVPTGAPTTPHRKMQPRTFWQQTLDVRTTDPNQPQIRISKQMQHEILWIVRKELPVPRAKHHQVSVARQQPDKALDYKDNQGLTDTATIMKNRVQPFSCAFSSVDEMSGVRGK